VVSQFDCGVQDYLSISLPFLTANLPNLSGGIPCQLLWPLAFFGLHIRCVALTRSVPTTSPSSIILKVCFDNTSSFLAIYALAD
jgi:hypothetical protein